MCLAGGGDKVTLRLWANGKTQTSGCKNVFFSPVVGRLVILAGMQTCSYAAKLLCVWVALSVDHA
eukprot:1709095-Rhodomonas_salina.1